MTIGVGDDDGRGLAHVAEAADAQMIRLELPADTRFLTLIDACVTATCAHAGGDHETLAQEVELAVHEACTNVMLHAYEGQTGGRMTIQLLLGAESLTVELLDSGHPFDPTLIPEPTLDAPQEHGYGLFLMRSLMDDVTYVANADCNHLRMSKRLYLNG